MWVKEQLGHASVAFMIEQYKHWMPPETSEAVDRLDGKIAGKNASNAQVNPSAGEK